MNLVKLIKTIFTPLYRVNWDSNLSESEYIPFRNNTFCIGKAYYRGKRNFMYSPRDDLVKYIGWLEDETTFYRYSSSIYSQYDDTDGKAVMSRERQSTGAVRSDIHFNCCKIY